MEIIIQQKFINMKQAVNSLREVSNSFKDLTGYYKGENEVPSSMSELLKLFETNVSQSASDYSPLYRVEHQSDSTCVEYVTASGKNTFIFHQPTNMHCSVIPDYIMVDWITDTTNFSSVFSAATKAWNITTNEELIITDKLLRNKNDFYQLLNLYNSLKKSYESLKMSLKLDLALVWDTDSIDTPFVIKSLIDRELTRKEFIIDSLRDSEEEQIDISYVLVQLGTYIKSKFSERVLVIE